MYRPHSDEMVKMAMGMLGMFVVHPRDPQQHRVDRDLVFVLSSFLIDPGTYLPKVVEMTDFNMWAWNARVRSRASIRCRCAAAIACACCVGNLTMTNHPIHLHGHRFQVTRTAARRRAGSRKTARAGRR